MNGSDRSTISEEVFPHDYGEALKCYRKAADAGFTAAAQALGRLGSAA